MRDTAEWAGYFATDWRQDVPDQIHTTQIGDDGTPMWHPDFEKWLTNDRLYQRRNDQQRLRTTRVMRRLRKASVREYEVAYRIRQQPWGQGMVLIALTGWGQESDRQHSQAAGFDHHLVKPVDPAELVRLLASLPAPP